MGDHGNRFGKVRQTNVGEIEDNNPCIFMSAPKNLRRNDTLIDNLRENSKELITHYDIYATMVEIANVCFIVYIFWLLYFCFSLQIHVLLIH
jgi:hypothetical protein